MQTKGIRKNIEKKLEAWFETITDKSLRKKLEENVLVSGGCIASMLTDEKVNDYDIYIKDMEVAFKLAQYYTKEYTAGIKVLDGRKKQEYLDKLNEGKDIFGEIFQGDTDDEDDIERAKHSYYGTCIRTLHENQIKLFFDSKKGGYKVERTKEEKEQAVGKYLPAFFSANAISLTDDLQIVLRFTGDNVEIHKTFDFIHATNYFTFKDGLVTNTKALESLLSKQLYYQGSLYPLTSIIRVRKFMKRGWGVNAGELLKCMFQISRLDLTNIDVLEEQLIGVDVVYFDSLIKLLRNEKGGLFLDSARINTLIDKIFNESDNEE